MGSFMLRGCTALVSGANRGIGRAYVAGLLAAGAARVYAGMRRHDPSVVALDPLRVRPLALDLGDAAGIAAAARGAGDVDLLINNAGVSCFGSLLGAPDLEGARTEMETNYLGTLAVIRAFAPVLAARGGGALVNVVSIAGLVSFPVIGSYSASKAALHSLTQGVRAELAPQGTLVLGVYPGPVDNGTTTMDVPAVPASVVVEATLEALARGLTEVFPDPMAQDLRARIAADPKAAEAFAAGYG